MSLIHNERVKLHAAALDRASTACLAVGVLGQLLSLSPEERMLIGLISPLAWIFAAIILHLIAWRVLGRLRP